MNSRLLVTAIVIAMFCINSCTLKPNDALTASEGFTMGTHYTVKIAHPPTNIDLQTTFKQVDNIFESINQSMSTYLDNSELSRLNKNTSADWITVSDDLFHVLKTANSISELTDGAFDVTAGSLVNTWGFGPQPEPEHIPDREKISSLLLHVSYQKIILHSEKSLIRKQDPKIYIDLSALAKGYAVDKASQYLASLGIENYMVEIGGDLYAHGLNQKNKPWRIAIEEPSINERKAHTIISLQNKAIATSGDYRNYYEKNGKRYSHTINPKTGLPIQHTLASVSVVHDNAIHADALATALMVLGTKRALQLANQHDIAAYFIEKSDKDFTVQTSSALKKLLKSSNATSNAH